MGRSAAAVNRLASAQLARTGRASSGCAAPGWARRRGAGTARAPAGTGQALNATNEGECYSFHSGGIHAVFGDTSTRFIAETIDIMTFAALVTRAGGEGVGEVP